MPWRRILIDWPSRIVDAWLQFYWWLAFLATSLSLISLALALVLYLVGIRWGW